MSSTDSSSSGQAPYVIRGGFLVDPATGREELGDIYVENGIIAEMPSRPPDNVEFINAKNLVVTPGFIDMHVHLREPGNEVAETIFSGSMAAARGGFTMIVAMPNTNPPIATPERVAKVKEVGDRAQYVDVRTTGTITEERNGKKVADLAGMAQNWAIAFTDDGYTVTDNQVMREAMEIARDLNIPIMDHAQDTELERKGVMHEGVYSKKFGLPGIPSYAEEKIIQRDIELAEETGATLHIQHVTSQEGVALIRAARARGVFVTGEATPHHLSLTDADIDPQDASFKMNPPLRTEADRQAIVEAVVDGTLQAFATDHAPHTAEAKAGGFMNAPFGLIGLETAVGVTYTEMVHSGIMDLGTWVKRWTTGPASILNLPPPSLAIGQPANLVILDLKNPWTVDADTFFSLSRNTPFNGLTITGRAIYTIYNGAITWRDPLTVQSTRDRMI